MLKTVTVFIIYSIYTYAIFIIIICIKFCFCVAGLQDSLRDYATETRGLLRQVAKEKTFLEGATIRVLSLVVLFSSGQFLKGISSGGQVTI